MDSIALCQLGQAVIETEAAAVLALNSRIDDTFAKACQCILACQGKVIVAGMGKSGHIARKIAATLASTGTPAFFVHPSEANHGDMGMITATDVVIALSNSGTTAEIISLLPLLKRKQVPLISLCGNPKSPIAQTADFNLDVSVSTEACPHNLAPTASTTAALVMGDALAVALLQARGFSADDFALSHPAGRLGRRLLIKIEDVMKTGDSLPKVVIGSWLNQAIIEITEKKLGLTLVINNDHSLAGIVTDGDLRRALEKNTAIEHTRVEDIMSSAAKTIEKGLLAVEALNIMEEFKITALCVVDANQHPIGLVHLHDIIAAGVI